MIPLAASGTIVISVAVVGALLLLAMLLRAEDRADAEERRDHGGAEERNSDI
jgi:hypothetical protein